MKGVWAIGLERSSFFEKAERYSAALDEHDDVWLYVDESVRKAAEPLTAPPNQWFSVEFVGRRSICDGLWGHMGMSQKAVIADQMLSVRR